MLCGAGSRLATPIDPGSNRGGLPPWAFADVDVRPGKFPGGAHPFDTAARAGEQSSQVIDVQQGLDAGGQRSSAGGTPLGSGLGCAIETGGQGRATHGLGARILGRVDGVG